MTREQKNEDKNGLQCGFSNLCVMPGFRTTVMWERGWVCNTACGLGLVSTSQAFHMTTGEVMWFICAQTHKSLGDTSVLQPGVSTLVK